jgi:hypothetical protein
MMNDERQMGLSFGSSFRRPIVHRSSFIVRNSSLIIHHSAMSRLHKTLADYLVIAVSPALIMVLIGSLVYFLLDVFYRGQHEGRLQYILTLFIIAAVLIGRISIEMGMEHAMMYAAPLALVTAIAINRFVVYQGTALAAYGWLINLGLMGLIWYCAHKLTWDCTVVNEDQDASGEGLLQRLGLDKKKGGPPPEPEKPAEPEGVTGREDRPRPWWERLKNPPPRPHSPGRSIIWFSLAALPMFGVGQLLIPASDTTRRRGAFDLLVVYVACALGLLLTTSFLGLRRYLRQRRLQMPVAMAGLWIFIGCLLIVAVLGFAAVLPRPNPEYAISQVPWKMTSPEHGSSRFAMGRDAAEKDADGSPTGQDQRGPDEQTKDLEPTRGSEGQNRPDAENAGKTQGKAPGDDGKSSADQGKSPGDQGKSPGDQGKSSSDQGESRGKQGNGKSGDGESRGKDSGQKDSGQDDGSDKSQVKGQAKRSGSQGKSSAQRGKQSSRGGESKGGDAQSPKPPKESPKSSGGRGAPPPPRPPSASPPSPPLPGLGFLAPLLKWLLYAVLIAAVAYGLWRSREELAAGLRRLLETWRNFWSWLFGGKRKEKAAAAEAESLAPRPPSRRFADFIDPFAAGTADRYRPDDLVRYSFEALEAWASENGFPREPDQTPYQFSRQVGARVKPLAGDLRTLADLYYRAAYARGSLSLAGVRPLAHFWERLRAEAASVNQIERPQRTG